MNSTLNEQDTCDISVTNCGSIFMFSPQTEEGREWLDSNVKDCPAIGVPIYCEHRYAWDIAEGAQNDGLRVS